MKKVLSIATLVGAVFLSGCGGSDSSNPAHKDSVISAIAKDFNVDYSLVETVCSEPESFHCEALEGQPPQIISKDSGIMHFVGGSEFEYHMFMDYENPRLDVDISTGIVVEHMSLVVYNPFEEEAIQPEFEFTPKSYRIEGNHVVVELPFDVYHTNLVPVIDKILESSATVLELGVSVDFIEGSGFAMDFFKGGWDTPAHKAALQILKQKNQELYNPSANTAPTLENYESIKDITVGEGDKLIIDLELLDLDGDEVKANVLHPYSLISMNEEGQLVINANKWYAPVTDTFTVNVTDGKSFNNYEFKLKIVK